MEYTDIEIAEIRTRQEEAKFKDIYDGEVRCGGEVLFFEKVNLYENRFSVMLPNTYMDLPGSMAKLKYPMENRPPVIKTNYNTTVNFAFGYYQQEFFEEHVESAANGLQAGMGRIYPGIRFFETRLMETQTGVKLSCFEFISPALDMELYQLFGFVPIHNRFLHFIFNAPSKLMQSWQPVALQVLQSICNI